MSVTDNRKQKRIMVMTKGHPFHREDFFTVFDEMEGVDACAVEQPACQVFFNPELARDYEAFVLYDMPGLDFFADDPPQYIVPSEKFRTDFLDLLEQGHGFVFLHHSIAGWPAWPEYAEILGGKFQYRTDAVRDKVCPDSGYRHAITHTLRIENDHPVVAGLPDEFTVTDELYLYHVFEQDLVPLLSSNYVFSEENFYSARQAVRGNMFSRENWSHAPGSSLIAWAKHFRNSPIVYLQCGDDKAAYNNPTFRTLLGNAIAWVSSDEARRWARERNARD